MIMNISTPHIHNFTALPNDLVCRQILNYISACAV